MSCRISNLENHYTLYTFITQQLQQQYERQEQGQEKDIGKEQEFCNYEYAFRYLFGLRLPQS